MARDELGWLGREVGVGRDTNVLADRLARNWDAFPTEMPSRSPPS